MPEFQISAITDNQEEAAIKVLVSSFLDNATTRWIWPNHHQYLESMPTLVEGLAGKAFANQSAFADSDVQGVGLWMPPGVEGSDEIVGSLIENTVEPDRLPQVLDLFGKLEAFHPHDEPIWYLPFLGVEPFSQGKGLGKALMEHALAQIDAEGLTAYLESSDPRNISLYLCHGFEVLGSIKVGSFNGLTPMIRRRK